VTDQAGAGLLQQFARLPRPGQVKTRLAAAIGAEEACAVHERLLEGSARVLLESQLAPAELWVDHAGGHALFDELIAAGMQGPRLQVGGDLGARMAHALADGLKRAARVVLVGSDCSGLDAAYLRSAFEALDSRDLVFGPAEDGGYVLVGAKRIEDGLFSGVEWGSDKALQQTLARAGSLGLSSGLLAMRYDIDELADLERWVKEGD
jgi:rSAM/selenodomain-associated transferase 1